MEETKIQKIVNKNRLTISRIPSWAKEWIVNKAESEHCGDYGACIAQVIREAAEYEALKRKFIEGELDVNILINDKHSPEKE